MEHKFGILEILLYVFHQRNNVDSKQKKTKQTLMSLLLCSRVELSHIQIGNTTLIGQVFIVDTACAVDFINWLSLNKRGMNSLNVLMARSWDGFHKQITQVVHVCEREWSAGWGACRCNHRPGSSYFRSSPVSFSRCLNLCWRWEDWIHGIYSWGIEDDGWLFWDMILAANKM